MAIGERIHFLRNLKGITQKCLGQSVGFPERTADVRMAQYEAGTRKPKEKLIENIATVLEVSPFALDVPNIENEVRLMHTLFVLEDLYGLKIEIVDREVCLVLDRKNTHFISMYDRFLSWQTEAQKFQENAITKEEYNNWRYTYSGSQNQ